jgi:hypothetical protein
VSERLAKLRVAAWTVASTMRPETCVACGREIPKATRVLRTRIDVFRCYPACAEWRRS